MTGSNRLSESPRLPIRSDLGWLCLASTVGGIVAFAYVTTHVHPAYEGGLFLQIVQEIQGHDYALPTQIPYYTRGGVPFAYPPLVFYLVAVIIDVTGVDPLTLMLYLPPLVTVMSLFPYYATAKELLESTPQAGVATVLYATTPAALRWHLSAGGLVRAPAIFLALAGTYVGVRLFKGGERRWLLPGTLLFGLTILTHPHYTAFFGVSYLVLFGFYDRTRRGLFAGAAVALGGALLASPWWLSVITTHGADTITAASGTHKGLVGGLTRLSVLLVHPLIAMDAATPFYALAILGSVSLLRRRRYVLPTWLLVSAAVIGKARFVFVPGAMASAVFLFETVLTTDRLPDVLRNGDRRALLLVVVILVGATTAGAMFAGSALNINHQNSDTQPQTVDSADRDAMAWARQDTADSASFVVLGDTAEWFPYLTQRTGVIGPWGVEWTSSERYYREIRIFERVSTCQSEACLTWTLARADRHPEYVYVPKDEYTVRGKEYVGSSSLRSSLESSRRYELAYENEGVAVFAVLDGGNERLSPRTMEMGGHHPRTMEMEGYRPRTTVRERA